MKTIHILMIVSLLLTLSTSCEYDKDCISGSGSIETQSYAVSDFDEISIHGTADVFLTQAGESSLIIEGQANVLDALHVENDNGSLSIGRDNCFKDATKLKIYASAKSLSRIEIAGKSDVYTQSTFSGADFYASIDGSGSMNLKLDVKEFTTRISGEGDITATGMANEQVYIVDGKADINCYKLQGNDGEIDIDGSASININVSDYLNVTIRGSGNIYYLGTPVINKDISGSGEIIAIN